MTTLAKAIYSALMRFALFLSAATLSLMPRIAAAEEPLIVAMPITLQMQKFEPLATNYTPHGFLAQNMFTPLLLRDEDGKLVSGSAKNWEYQKGGLELAVTLDQNYRWSNGDMVTASDFRRGFERLLKASTSESINTIAAWLLVGDSIVGINERLNGDEDAHLGIRVEGDDQIVYELTSPYSLRIQDLTIANWAIPMHPADAEHEGKWLTSPNRYSNGAYYLDSYTDGKAVLRRNPFFGGETSAYEVVEFTDHTRSNIIDLYIKGEVDILLGPFGDQQPWLVENFEEQLFTLSSPRVYILRSSHRSELLSDPDIRRAIFLGLDRDTFSKGFFNVAHIPLEGMIPAGMNGYNQSDKSKVWPESFAERRDIAVSILKDKGIDPQKTINLSLIVATEVAGYTAIQNFVTSYLEKLGVNVEVIQIARYADAVRAFGEGKADMMIDSSWQYDTWGFLSTDVMYQAIAHTPDGKTYSALLSNARKQTDPEDYLAAIDEANAFSMDRQWIIPVAAVARIAFTTAELGPYKKSLHELNLNYIRK